MQLKKRDAPCERCGWVYEGFHVCFDASKPCPGEGKVDVRPRAKSGPKTSSGRAIISSMQSERWAEYREDLRPRDEQIVARYEEGLGLKALAQEFEISHSTVIGVIRREEERTGKTIMRPRGLNYRHAKREVAGGFQ